MCWRLVKEEEYFALKTISLCFIKNLSKKFYKFENFFREKVFSYQIRKKFACWSSRISFDRQFIIFVILSHFSQQLFSFIFTNISYKYFSLPFTIFTFIEFLLPILFPFFLHFWIFVKILSENHFSILKKKKTFFARMKMTKIFFLLIWFR